MFTDYHAHSSQKRFGPSNRPRADLWESASCTIHRALAWTRARYCVHVAHHYEMAATTLSSSLLDIKPSQLDHIEDGICRVGSGREDEEIGIDDPRLITKYFVLAAFPPVERSWSWRIMEPDPHRLLYKPREPVLHVPHSILSTSSGDKPRIKAFHTLCVGSHIVTFHREMLRPSRRTCN